MAKVPNDACPTCGTLMEQSHDTMSLPVCGVEVEVPNIPHLRCPSCGEEMLSFEQAKQLRLQAYAIWVQPRMVPTGFKQLDHLAPFMLGDLVMVASRPGMGVTSLALTICQNVTAISIPVLWFALMTSMKDLVGPWLAASGRDPRQMAAAAVDLAALPFSVDDGTDSTIKNMLTKAVRWRAGHQEPKALVVVDTLEMVPREPELRRSRRPESEVEREHLQAVASGLKAMAKELSATVLLLARYQATEGRGDPRPVLGDLWPASLAAAQHADTVGFLYRDAEASEFIVAKQKNGPVGSVHLAVELRPRLRFLSDNQDGRAHVD